MAEEDFSHLLSLLSRNEATGGINCSVTLQRLLGTLMTSPAICTGEYENALAPGRHSFYNINIVGIFLCSTSHSHSWIVPSSSHIQLMKVQQRSTSK